MNIQIQKIFCLYALFPKSPPPHPTHSKTHTVRRSIPLQYPKNTAIAHKSGFKPPPPPKPYPLYRRCSIVNQFCLRRPPSPPYPFPPPAFCWCQMACSLWSDSFLRRCLASLGTAFCSDSSSLAPPQPVVLRELETLTPPGPSFTSRDFLG